MQSALVSIAFLFLLRVVVRRTWLACFAYVLLSIPIGISNAGSGRPIYSITVSLSMFVLGIAVLFRVRIVARVVFWFVGMLAGSAPFTLDLSRWYALPSLTLFGLLIAIAVNAYRLALPKAQLLRDEMLYR
jgi:hypothetical protein